MKSRKSGNARKAIQVALLAGLASGVAQAADSFFLYVPGVKGESIDSKHFAWIDVLSFAHSVSSWNCPRFVVTKRIDLATPALLASSSTGSPYSDMVLSGVATGATSIEYLSVKMSNVVVSSSRQSGVAGDPRATEEIVLDPTAVSVLYTSIDAKGGAGPQSSSAYACKNG